MTVVVAVVVSVAVVVAVARSAAVVIVMAVALALVRVRARAVAVAVAVCLASRLAQGKVGRGAAALALLALLGSCSSPFAGCWGYCVREGIGGNVGALAAASGRLAVRLASRLAQGKVGRGAAALASLALLGLLLSAMVGC